MADVFGREVEIGTGFKADGAKINFAGKDCNEGLLIQNVSSLRLKGQYKKLY